MLKETTSFRLMHPSKWRRIHKEPMIHYYAKDILDEHNHPVFDSDKAYSVKDVQDKGYCCYSGPIPCPEKAEAFFVDCHGNPKQRFLCQQKLGQSNLPDRDYFCETHSFYGYLRQELILTEEQKEALRVNGRKDRMLELFIEFMVKNRCKMLRPNFNRSGWSHLDDHLHEIFIPNHWATFSFN